MVDTPCTSVIVTVRDEPAARLQRMLAAIAAQDCSAPIEVVIAAPAVDAPTLGSLRPAGAVNRIVLVDNPTGARSAGLNRARRAASGTIVHRVDARSVIPPDYIRRATERLEAQPEVGVVGGHQHPVADAGAREWERGLARALANPWAAGGAPYRRGARGGAVDTVYLGSFRGDDLERAGGYDERLDANEDFELCQRIRAAGQQVWLEAGLVVDYEARARLSDLWRQYDAFGRSKVRYWRLHHTRPNARQLLGVAGPLAIAAVAVAVVIGAGAARGVLALGVGGAAGLLALDHAGGGRHATVPARVAGAIGVAVLPTAWAAGVYRALFKRR